MTSPGLPFPTFRPVSPLPHPLSPRYQHALQAFNGLMLTDDLAAARTVVPNPYPHRIGSSPVPVYVDTPSSVGSAASPPVPHRPFSAVDARPDPYSNAFAPANQLQSPQQQHGSPFTPRGAHQLRPEPSPSAVGRRLQLDLLYLFSSPLVTLGPITPLSQINCETEYKELTDILFERRLQIRFQSACATRESFSKLLNTGFHVLHFSGHGLHDGLAFEAEDRSMHKLTVLALRDLLKFQPRTDSLRLVVVSACHSALQIAEIFIAAGVPHVIALSAEVKDSVGRQFTKIFYDTLLAGRSIGEAFSNANNYVQRNCDPASGAGGFHLLPHNTLHTETLFTDVPAGTPVEVSRRDDFPSLIGARQVTYGRECEMWNIVTKLVTPGDFQAAPVLITGPRGIGKTHIANAVAHYVYERRLYRDGVFCIDMPSMFSHVTKEEDKSECDVHTWERWLSSLTCEVIHRRPGEHLATPLTRSSSDPALSPAPVHPTHPHHSHSDGDIRSPSPSSSPSDSPPGLRRVDSESKHCADVHELIRHLTKRSVLLVFNDASEVLRSAVARVAFLQFILQLNKMCTHVRVIITGAPFLEDPNAHHSLSFQTVQIPALSLQSSSDMFVLHASRALSVSLTVAQADAIKRHPMLNHFLMSELKGIPWYIQQAATLLRCSPSLGCHPQPQSHSFLELPSLWIEWLSNQFCTRAWRAAQLQPPGAFINELLSEFSHVVEDAEPAPSALWVSARSVLDDAFIRLVEGNTRGLTNSEWAQLRTAAGLDSADRTGETITWDQFKTIWTWIFHMTRVIRRILPYWVSRDPLWVQGVISRLEAESRLTNVGHGTFLLRFSTSNAKEPLVLSFASKEEGVSHSIVEVTSQGFAVQVKGQDFAVSASGRPGNAVESKLSAATFEDFIQATNTTYLYPSLDFKTEAIRRVREIPAAPGPNYGALRAGPPSSYGPVNNNPSA